MDSPYLYQLITVAGFSTSIVWMAFIGFPQYYLAVFEEWTILNGILQLHLHFHYQKSKVGFLDYGVFWRDPNMFGCAVNVQLKILNMILPSQCQI